MLGRLITRRLVGLIAADLVCVLVALWLAPVLYPLLARGRFVPGGYLHRPLWQLAAVGQLYIFYLAGLYDAEERRSRVLLATKSAIATAAMTMALLGAYFFHYRQSRGVIVLYWPLAFVCVVAGRTLLGKMRPEPPQNVALVCIGHPAPTDLEMVQNAARGAYRFKGVIVCNDHEADAPADASITRITDPAELERIARTEGIAVLVVARGAETQPRLVRELVQLSYQGVLLSEPVAFYERSMSRLPCEYMGHAAFLLLHVDQHKSVYPKLRRMLDVGLSIVGIVLSSPLWVAAAVAVKLGSRAPLLVTEERVGLEGESFALIKFRTTAAGEDAGPVPNPSLDDPRVTPVGRLLRKTRIDELPQLINVLRGDMSLIGPRPEHRALVEQFEREIPYYQERHAVRPGITGWAQVNQGYVLGTEATREKLSYDLFYLKNRSLTLDLMIAFMTIKALLWGGGQ